MAEIWSWTTETKPTVTVYEHAAKHRTLYLRWYEPRASEASRRANYRYRSLGRTLRTRTGHITGEVLEWVRVARHAGESAAHAGPRARVYRPAGRPEGHGGVIVSGPSAQEERPGNSPRPAILACPARLLRSSRWIRVPLAGTTVARSSGSGLWSRSHGAKPPGRAGPDQLELCPRPGQPCLAAWPFNGHLQPSMRLPPDLSAIHYGHGINRASTVGPLPAGAPLEAARAPSRVGPRARVVSGFDCSGFFGLGPVHPDPEARPRRDVWADAVPCGGRHVEATQLALTAIPHDDLYEAALRHREHVEGNERVYASTVGPIHAASQSTDCANNSCFATAIRCGPPGPLGR
jgi:hypothetical protein